MEFQRILDLSSLVQKKSILFLGPRSTGKTYLIREQLGSKATVIDLLSAKYFIPLSQDPSLLAELVASSRNEIIVIDEIQKIPALFDEVHKLIEEKKIKFLLTGSSARKLNRGQSNLLAGRAWPAFLFPLSSYEIPKFQLDRYLQFGGLPAVYKSKYPQEELYAYINTYLKEEIQAEGLVRKLPLFSRFLLAAAISNGQLLNFESIGQDAQVSPSTIREYFQLLQDTLIGFLLEPYTKTKKRKAIQTAKFYFFDLGVRNTLAQIQNIERNSDAYGQAFEHFIILEIRAYISYRRLHHDLYFWRSVNKQEVDVIIGDKVAIEIKSSTSVQKKHLTGLLALQEEKKINDFYLLSNDELARKVNGIHCIHWKEFLKLLWNDKII